MKIVNKEINNIKTTFITTDKFKTITFKIFFSGQFSKESATKRSLLARILSTSSKKYKTKKEMSEKLFDLYDASYGVAAYPSYETSIINYTLEVVNEKYLADANITKEALNFLKETCFNPNINNNNFNEKVFQEEKRLLKSSIENIYNNKNRFALRRLLQTMCKDEITSVSALGDLKDLEQITNEELYQTYLEMIKQDAVSIYVIGDFVVDEMAKELEKHFKFSSRHGKNFPLFFTKSRVNIDSQEVHEYQDINQTKLLMGFRTNITPIDELITALLVFNSMYGGLFVSDLFKVVREKHSLAYQIASQISAEAGLLIVSAGIDKENINKTTSLIIQELRNYQDGHIDFDLLSVAKENIINELKEVEDNPHSLLMFIQRQDLLSLDRDINNYIEKVKSITPEDIIKAAKLIELDTIYTLSKKEGNNNEN